MIMKSWRTTFFGVGCFVACALLVNENIRREAWSLHYWAEPFLAFACGWGLWHARDHKAK
jgi:hypothetical protein